MGVYLIGKARKDGVVKRFVVVDADQVSTPSGAAAIAARQWKRSSGVYLVSDPRVNGGFVREVVE
jgi:hypothetical protein